ncbi:DUF4012 domain-containing protein [Microbacterium sp. NPDC056003]|uniref:DUF4012 domain-containing protein n=1 Tax=Microbacterium sp. NPDC056003 TaxID=3345676 RepID=UPI0035D884C9
MTEPVAGRRRVSRRTVLLVVGAVVLVVVGLAAWVGIRALLVKDQLEAMAPMAAELQDAAAARDLARVDSAVGQLAGRAAEARALSGDPAWRIAEFVPVLGANLGAARVVSAQLDEISRAVEELIPALQGAAESSNEDGGFDIDRLAELAPSVQHTSDAITGAAEALADIDRGPLLSPLSDGVGRLAALTAEAAPVAESLASAMAVLPPMLGLDGERHILVMLQNSAEVRTGGGITGSFVLVRADRGTLDVVDQADGGQFAARTEPIAPVPESVTALYGDRVGRFVQNTSMPSDFDVTSELVRAWWATRSDVAPDAILSVDMWAVRALLSATGPIPLPDGSELTADNLVQRVLVDPYLSLDVEQQTVYQRELTRALMSGILTKDIDPFAWAEALAGPVEQGHVALWSAHADEAERLAEGPLGGPAARQQAAGADAFAVYFNDATSGKMGPFLDLSMSAGTAQCRPDGKREVAVSVSLANTAPPDAGTTLPWWLTGGGLEGVRPGDIATNVTVSAPPGAFFGGVRVDGERVISTDVEEAGFPSSAAAVTMAPGETRVLEFRFVMDSDRDFAPVVLHTPLIGDPEIDIVPVGCD